MWDLHDAVLVIEHLPVPASIGPWVLTWNGGQFALHWTMGCRNKPISPPSGAASGDHGVMDSF